jgi:hypothetical protein
MSPTDRPKPPNVGPPQDGPDPDDPPSDDELRAAETLRHVLEGGEDRGERKLDSEERRTREWSQSLRAAASLRDIAPERHRQLIERALATSRATPSAKRKVIYLAFGGAAGVLAMAAAVAIVVRGSAPDASMSAPASTERTAAPLALSRSTADLFPEGIPREGGTSRRVDRIAYARAQDFRQNQFARWGAP